MDMSLTIPDYTFIESDRDLLRFQEQNQGIDWLCLDTEFVGEKRYHTLLCLIQLTTPNGCYLIDPFSVKDLDPFLGMIQDPAILKITHAGENDYRLLNANFGILPRNVFDCQIAAGFVGYRYPLSFGKLVEEESGLQLSKGYTVADWESRPLNKKQLKYALGDVLPLYDLWRSLDRKLARLDRQAWAREELKRLEELEFYVKDPNSEALNSNLMRSLRTKERAFLLRLFEWRRKEAEARNYSKEMILPTKLMGQIVKSMRSGRDGLRQNRRISDKVVKKFGDTFQDLYNRKVTSEERAILERIPSQDKIDPREEILQEMLYLLVRHICLEADVAIDLVMPRKAIRKLRRDDPEEQLFYTGWRRQLLGDEFIEWMENIDQLDIRMQGGNIELTLRDTSNGD